MMAPSPLTMTMPCTFLWVCMRLRVSSTSDMLQLSNYYITIQIQFQMSRGKPTIFAPAKTHRVFFLAELLQPYYGAHPEHHFPELDSFPAQILSNEMLRRLYELTIDNLNVHNNADAIFFADKLVSLSNYHTAAVYLLGECYFRNGDFKKVHTLFQQHKMIDKNISFQLLVARALLMNKQYELCLTNLEIQLHNTYCNRKMEACKAFIAAQCYEAQENKLKAVDYYKDCVLKDPTNVEAFNRLVDCQLITGVEKVKLLESLTFPPEDQWLRKIFESKVKSIEEGQLAASGEEIRRDNVFENLVAKENINILCIRAKTLYQHYRIPAAYELCVKAIKKDPLCFEILPIYATCLLDLGMTGQLYYCAHNLVENYSSHPVSWFTVGTYYFHCKKYEVARKYFQKAIILDKSFLFAWIGMAHSFAVQDQSDQAMSIYRTIMRLFPGCAQAHLYMGMEYLRTNNLKTATLSLQKAREINPNDPLIYSELGVINYKQKNYRQARRYHEMALEKCHPDSCFWVRETILTNLAHACRKLREYKQAVGNLQQCVSLNSSNPQTFFSLGFIYHLSGQLNKAISFYHKSLKFKHDNQFAQQMLQKAITDASELSWDSVYNS